jgi:hypothetical protein
MVESVIADGCVCSKFTAKSLLQVVIRVGRYCGHMGLVSLFPEEPPLFLLFLQEIISGNHSSPVEMLDFG